VTTEQSMGSTEIRNVSHDSYPGNTLPSMEKWRYEQL